MQAPAAPWVPPCRGSPGTVPRPQCCGVSEDSAETDSGSFSSAAAVHHPSSLHPALPCYSTKRGLGPAVLWKVPSEQRCGVTAGLRHAGRSGSVSAGMGLRLLQPFRGMKPPACRELPQHPCACIYQVRWITRLSRGCLN